MRCAGLGFLCYCCGAAMQQCTLVSLEMFIDDIQRCCLTWKCPRHSMRSHTALPPRYVDEGKLLNGIHMSLLRFDDRFCWRGSLPSPDARRFDSHRHEVNTWNDIIVLQSFVDLSCSRGRTRLVAACYQVTQLWSLFFICPRYLDSWGLNTTMKNSCLPMYCA